MSKKARRSFLLLLTASLGLGGCWSKTEDSFGLPNCELPENKDTGYCRQLQSRAGTAGGGGAAGAGGASAGSSGGGAAGTAGAGGGAGAGGASAGSSAGGAAGTAGAGGAAGAAGTPGHEEPLPEGIEDCIAPCVWRLIRNCRPERACTKDVGSDGLRYCEPETGWRAIILWDREERAVEAWKSGRLCYYADRTDGAQRYFWPNGEPAATLYGDNANGYATCPEDQPEKAYPLPRKDDPACAPYVPIECVSGICP